MSVSSCCLDGTQKKRDQWYQNAERKDFLAPVTSHFKVMAEIQNGYLWACIFSFLLSSSNLGLDIIWWNEKLMKDKQVKYSTMCMLTIGAIG